MNALEILNLTTEKESSRYKHLTACCNLANELLQDVPINLDIKEKILNTVLLHDIGYSHTLNVTGEHNIDGYNFLNKNHPDLCFHKIVLLHGDFINYCPTKYNEILESVYDSLTDLEFAVLIIVDYCDHHIDGLGNEVTIDGRWKDIKNRHSADSKVLKVQDDLIKYSYHIEKIIDRILNILPDIL